MKLKFFSLIPLLLAGGFLSAQMPGMMTMQQASAPQGTTLGANTTSGAAGIALGNRVIMRGYVDFIFSYDDADNNSTHSGSQTEKFSTAADVDFLFDFSPVTAELHVAMDKDDISLEQAFGRYAFNRDFNLSFGRQLTVLGYEADEAPGLFAVTNAYLLGDKASSTPTLPVKTRRNYKDGARANFNNGKFGLSVGLHDGYWLNDDFNNDNIALDIAASLMIIPGLEARLGYAHEEVDYKNSNISQFNTFLAYNPGDLTLALEYDNFDIMNDDYWSMMFLANYQFVDFLAATLRYSHEDYESGGIDHEADRFTFALLFTITQNLFFNLEYSTTSMDSVSFGDYDEFYLEALLTF